MVYVALLRGINVGGNRKVDMKQLKEAFENAGMQSVNTYINSGNVIFNGGSEAAKALVKKLELAIKNRFGFEVKVLLRDINSMRAVVNAVPESWQNHAATKCDVMFLWEAVDGPEVLKRLTIKPSIDEVKYAAGAVLWCVDRKALTRSGMPKLVGTKLYSQMTIRNCNTARKLVELMELVGR